MSSTTRLNKLISSLLMVIIAISMPIMSLKVNADSYSWTKCTTTMTSMTVQSGITKDLAITIAKEKFKDAQNNDMVVFSGNDEVGYEAIIYADDEGRWLYEPGGSNIGFVVGNIKSGHTAYVIGVITDDGILPELPKDYNWCFCEGYQIINVIPDKGIDKSKALAIADEEIWDPIVGMDIIYKRVGYTDNYLAIEYTSKGIWEDRANYISLKDIKNGFYCYVIGTVQDLANPNSYHWNLCTDTMLEMVVDYGTTADAACEIAKANFKNPSINDMVFYSYQDNLYEFVYYTGSTWKYLPGGFTFDDIVAGCSTACKIYVIGEVYEPIDVNDCNFMSCTHAMWRLNVDKGIRDADVMYIAPLLLPNATKGDSIIYKGDFETDTYEGVYFDGNTWKFYPGTFNTSTIIENLNLSTDAWYVIGKVIETSHVPDQYDWNMCHEEMTGIEIKDYATPIDAVAAAGIANYRFVTATEGDAVVFATTDNGFIYIYKTSENTWDTGIIGSVEDIKADMNKGHKWYVIGTLTINLLPSSYNFSKCNLEMTSMTVETAINSDIAKLIATKELPTAEVGTCVVFEKNDDTYKMVTVLEDGTWGYEPANLSIESIKSLINNGTNVFVIGILRYNNPEATNSPEPSNTPSPEVTATPGTGTQVPTGGSTGGATTTPTSATTPSVAPTTTSQPTSVPSSVPTLAPTVAPTAAPELNVGDFINRCYSVALGRSADSAGFSYWVESLTGGQACGAQVGYGFIFSQEYINKNRSDEEFVNDMYAMYFGREADSDGFNYWVGLLESGLTREDIMAGFANSEEFYNLCNKYGVVCGTYLVGVPNDVQGGVNCFVARLYKVCLNRLPDMGGQAGWVLKLMNGEVSGTSAAYGFVFSPEFIGKNPSNEAFVNYMYAAFFGREADEAGFNAWVDVLNGGGSYEDVFKGFSGSAEFANLCASYGIQA